MKSFRIVLIFAYSFFNREAIYAQHCTLIESVNSTLSLEGYGMINNEYELIKKKAKEERSLFFIYSDQSTGSKKAYIVTWNISDSVVKVKCLTKDSVLDSLEIKKNGQYLLPEINKGGYYIVSSNKQVSTHQSILLVIANSSNGQWLEFDVIDGEVDDCILKSNTIFNEGYILIKKIATTLGLPFALYSPGCP